MLLSAIKLSHVIQINHATFIGIQLTENLLKTTSRCQADAKQMNDIFTSICIFYKLEEQKKIKQYFSIIQLDHVMVLFTT